MFRVWRAEYEIGFKEEDPWAMSLGVVAPSYYRQLSLHNVLYEELIMIV